MRSAHTFVALVGLVASSVLPSWAIAGPLDPPPGPITETGKTLTEVEPRIALSAANTPGDADSIFRISQAGSYYLTGNLIGQPGKHGIEIAAAGVTIDLMGFSLIGVAGTLDAITSTVAGVRNLAIRNGSIRAWDGDGVDLGSVLSLNADVRELRVYAVGGTGIRVGQISLITSCTVDICGIGGIVTDIGCVVTGCAAAQITGDGFSIGPNSVVSECTALNVSGHGFELGSETTVTARSAGGATGSGFSSTWGCTYTACTATGNATNGFVVLDDSVLDSCAARFNGAEGFKVVNSNSAVLDCTAVSNNGHGIFVGFRNRVAGCTVSVNGLDGIRADNQNVIVDNACTQNGSGGDGAGIRTLGNRNRIEGNECSSADRGIDVDGANNIILRNTCSSNTVNWTIVANNVFGNIMDRRAPASAAVNGHAAGSSAGTTDPHANFSY